MIEHAYKELYGQDGVNKQLTIVFDSGSISNEDLYSESFELTESLCSESEVKFGTCEASVVKFKIRNNIQGLNGKKITITETLNGDSENIFSIGTYKVHSDVPSGDRNYRNITAYDSMHDIINADVTEWYKSMEFPMTLKEFRDSFFAHLEIEQEEISLIHDEMVVEKTITGTGISGKLIIVCICELNGVFGHVNRQGKFVYVNLPQKNINTIYPILELYPTQSLYANAVYRDGIIIENITKSNYITCEYEDFDTKFITKIQLRQEENDLGVISGDGTNCYIVEGNFLVYGKNEEELQSIADKILEKIQYTQYKPFKAKLKGNPCIEVGDAVVLHTKNGNIRSYVLERTLTGIQGLKDNFQAQGIYEYKEKVNSLKKDIQKLKGKSNVLERTLENTRSEIADIESGLNTKIEQNAESINTVVQRIETNTNEAFESINEDIEKLTKRVETSVTAEQVKIEVKSELEKGTTKVATNTGYVFDDEGLKISKSDSEMETTISDNGMSVKKNGEKVLTANSEGVDAVNLHATTYLIVGSGSRFEDYEKNGEKRTGCFWIGG